MRYFKLNLFMMAVLVLGFGFSFAQAQENSLQTIKWDNFDNLEYWSVGTWGDGAQISQSQEHAAEGDKSLKIHFTKEGRKFQGKGVVVEKEQIALDVDSTKKIILDVYNDAGPMKMAVVLHTGDFCESSPITLRPGWNKNIVIDLEAKNFKSSASKWKYNYSLISGSIVWRTMLIFYRGDIEEGDLYVSNIRIEKVPRLGEEQIPIAVSKYQKPEIIALVVDEKEVKQYEKFEVTVNFKGTYQYPYDPKDIALDAEFISPSGVKFSVPGFLYAAGIKGIKVDSAVWKVRFAPNEVGTWKYKVTVANPKGRSVSKVNEFICQPSNSRGNLRISKIDPMYFEFDNGGFYYPIGQNVAWASSAGAFDYYFSKMSKNGYNWTRIWMSSWQFALEWLDVGHYYGLGNYSLRNAEYLDRTVELAEKNNLYFQLVLNNHGQLSTKVDPEWINNPYNAKNGGPCKRPQDFFTNKDAKRLLKNRLRYIVARWGYSTNIFAWELWNEVTLTDNYNAKVDIAWHKEMSAYLKKIDPYKHLITTSYFGSFPDGIWKVKNLDYGQIHMYTPEIVSTLGGIYQLMRPYHKPYFVGEFGTSNLDGIDRMDSKATNQHAAIWAQFVTPSAGDAMCWEWDNHIDPNNLYYHWKALAAFAEGEDRRCRNYSYARATITGQDNKSLSVQGILNNQQAMFWIFDLDRTKFKQKILPALYVEGAGIELGGMLDGIYLVEFWDTYTGQILKVIGAECKNSHLNIELPVITKDIACKVKLARLAEFQDVKTVAKPRLVSSYPERPLPPRAGKLWEDFEKIGDWHLADWGDKAKLTLSKEHTTSGKKALKVTFSEKGRRSDAKGIVVEKNDLNLDLKNTKKMIFDIYNDNPESFEVSVVLNSTGFCESVREIVNPGQNTITIDLGASNFKKSESRWTHGATLDKNRPIHQMMIIAYPWDIVSGEFYLDNIRF